MTDPVVTNVEWPDAPEFDDPSFPNVDGVEEVEQLGAIAGSGRTVKPGEEPIGIGLPLRMAIRRIYRGPAPSHQNVLVMSEVKAFGPAEPGPKAVNLVAPESETKPFLEWGGGSTGSPHIYYSPAMSDERLVVTLTINLDGFDVGKAQSWVASAASIAALPVFLGTGLQGQAIVRAASGVAGLLVTVIDRFIDPEEADLKLTLQVNVVGDRHGGVDRNADVILWPEDDYWNAPQSAILTPGKGREIRGHRLVARDGKVFEVGADVEFAGPFQYVLLSVDGRKDDGLKKWKPAKMTAELSARFSQARDGDAIEGVSEALSAFSDLRTIQEIQKLRNDAKKEKDADKASKLTERAKALLDEIQDEELQNLAADN